MSYIELKLEQPVKETVKEIVKLGGIVAGGYARYLASEDEFMSGIYAYGDIDIFTPNHVEFCRVFNFLKEHSVDYVSGFNNSRFTVANEEPDYNLIVPDTFRKFTTTQELVESFDLTICQVALDKDGLHGTSDFYVDNRGDRIAFSRDYTITNPIGSMKRLIKYAKKGYEIKADQIEKVMLAYKDGFLGDASNGYT